MDIVQQGAQLPVGGRLVHFARNWGEISSDPWILKTVQGYQVEFHTAPQQVGCPNEIGLNTTQSQALTKEVEELVRKEAIVTAPLEQGGFTSQMFLVPKSDGSQRPNAEQRLACQARPERCLPFNFHPSIMPKIPQIQMGMPNMAVQSTPLWSEQRSIRVHQVNKASGLCIEEVGDQINSVSR